MGSPACGLIGWALAADASTADTNTPDASTADVSTARAVILPNAFMTTPPGPWPVSRYLIHHRLVGDAAQRGALQRRLEARVLEDLRGLWILDYRPGRQDGARGSEALDARGHVHGLAEIILTFVQHDREAWPLVNADLEQQILVPAFGIDARHFLPHQQ